MSCQSFCDCNLSCYQLMWAAQHLRVSQRCHYLSLLSLCQGNLEPTSRFEQKKAVIYAQARDRETSVTLHK